MLRALSMLLCLGLSQAFGRDLTLHVDTSPGGFSVVFSASPEPVSAIQFDLTFDNPVSVFPSPGLATRLSDKMMAMRYVDGNRIRFVIYGLGTTDIGSGSLVEIGYSLQAAGGASSVKIDAASAVFGNGTGAPIDTQTTALALFSGSPLLTQAGVWNAASGQASAVSAGAIMTLRGGGIGPDTDLVPAEAVTASALGGIRVTFDDSPAPLLYAGPNQINLLAPWSIVNRAATQVTVTRDFVAVAGVSAPVATASPEIFTLSTNGTGGGAVINEDGSVNTPLNPAPPNSVISIYGTGLGPMSPGGVDGAIAGLAYANSAVSVTIGGVTAEVLYAGSAPGLVSGAFQVNCRVPAEVGGLAVEVRVSSGEARSAPGVTVAIQARE